MKSFYAILFLLLFSAVSCSSGSDKQNNVQGEVDKEMINAYKNNPIVYIPPSVFPVEGNPTAKVKIDIFFDPWCGPCRFFDQEVSSLLSETSYAQKVAVYFHLFPLGNHFPNDREASLLHLEMAKRNLYREFRNRVVNENTAEYKDMLDIAESLTKTKLPLSLLEKNNARLYNEQLKVAKETLNLGHTPTVFINNREYPSTPNIQELKILIDENNK